MDDRLLTTTEVAARARTAESTVRYWRHAGIGPAGFKVGRRVLYREVDVQGWLDGLRASDATRANSDTEQPAKLPRPAAEPPARR